MNTGLRLTDTNSASDSSGRTWGLEGNLVWWLVGGLGLGIVVLFVLLIGFDFGLLPAIGTGLVPVVLVLGYVFTLRQGKPPGYDRDIVESLLGGRGFLGERTRPTRHPLIVE